MTHSEVERGRPDFDTSQSFLAIEWFVVLCADDGSNYLLAVVVPSNGCYIKNEIAVVDHFSFQPLLPHWSSWYQKLPGLFLYKRLHGK